MPWRPPSTGGTSTPAQALALADCDDLARLTELAEQLCLAGHGTRVSFSKKVFIPLTQAVPGRLPLLHVRARAAPGEPPYLSPEAVLDIARAGPGRRLQGGAVHAGRPAGAALRRRARGAGRRSAPTRRSTIWSDRAALVLKETGLLPHLNPGVMDEAWLARLRKVSVSQGIMLETASDRLSQRGGPHFGSPDKVPAVRLATLEAAGRARVPFTTGILIGIGETRAERIEALLAIRDVHERHGHIQEVIIQNFRAKPGTRMARRAGALARGPRLDHRRGAPRCFGPAMNIQAPPNLQPDGPGAARPGRHQRLGRRVARHARPRQPRGALAASRRPRARHRARRPHAGRAAGDLS